jgi:hypothetical protein
LILVAVAGGRPLLRRLLAGGHERDTKSRVTTLLRLLLNRRTGVK